MTAAELLRQKLQAAQARVDRLTEVRRKLPATANRARRTTAASRWARACEERDGLLLELELDHGAYFEQLATRRLAHGA